MSGRRNPEGKLVLPEPGPWEVSVTPLDGHFWAYQVRLVRENSMLVVGYWYRLTLTGALRKGERELRRQLARDAREKRRAEALGLVQ